MTRDSLLARPRQTTSGRPLAPRRHRRPRPRRRRRVRRLDERAGPRRRRRCRPHRLRPRRSRRASFPRTERIAARLRTLGKPVVVAWNKVDTQGGRAGARAGATSSASTEVFAVSASTASAPTSSSTSDREAPSGRPRPRDARRAAPGRDRRPAERRQVVDRQRARRRRPRHGLRDRRDDARLDRRRPDAAAGKSYLLVDTAGIRRKGKTTDSAEMLSVVAARKSMERARVAVIVFDASEGITAQDAHIAGYAEEAGRGLVLVANKWDLIERDREGPEGPPRRGAPPLRLHPRRRLPHRLGEDGARRRQDPPRGRRASPGGSPRSSRRAS